METTIPPQTLEKLVGWRHYLHQHPDLSGSETETAVYIRQQLKQFRPDRIETGLGGCGLAAFFDSGKAGPTLLFRAELDALPIKEKNAFSHRSRKEGISHKCGHDGHMTFLLGLGSLLKKRPFKKGQVILLFQPAEETGEGAQRVLQDPRIEGWDPKYVFAIHNIPGYKMGTVLIKTGSFSAEVHSVAFHLQGKTAHAGEPELGTNPAQAISEILALVPKLSQTDPAAKDFRLITPIYTRLGEKAYGVSAGDAEVHFTIRTWTHAEMENLKDELVATVRSITDKYQLSMEPEWMYPFYANRNHPDAVTLVKMAAQLEELRLTEREEPFRWGEDFGLFTQRYPGAMIGLGSGIATTPLHSPDYDFPDDLSEKGIRLFYRLVQLELN